MQTLKEYLFKQEAEFKEYVGKGIDPVKQQQLHEDIESGKIDKGPTADHSEPVKDIRPVVDGETARLFTKAGKQFVRPLRIDDLPLLQEHSDSRNGSGSLP